MNWSGLILAMTIFDVFFLFSISSEDTNLKQKKWLTVLKLSNKVFTQKKIIGVKAIALLIDTVFFLHFFYTFLPIT